MSRNVTATAIVTALLTLRGSGETPVGDWPQWRGPERSGISKESGLLKQWPAGGPPLAWQTANLGEQIGKFGGGALAVPRRCQGAQS